MSRILVVGASGTVGSELARLLAAQGESVVKVTSRLPSAADQVRVDIVSRAGLHDAFESVDRAFLLSPPGHANQYELLAPLIDEARARGLQKVVLMSAMGANADDNSPLRRAEKQLEASGLPYNIIRPNWFMQNFNTFWAAGIRDDGRIRLPVGTAKASFIDARDIAAVATRLLTTHDQDGRDFDLTGPAALDHDGVARILSRATGRAIAFEDIEPGVLRQGLLAGGVPADYAEFLLVILGFLKQGYAERTTDSVRQLLGREPAGFEAYAQRHRSDWARAA